MPSRSRKESPSLPEWWNSDLYDFVRDMPLEGWCWEFSRRSALKNSYRRPVQAMNPNFKGQNFWYLPWPEIKDKYVRLGLIPAVLCRKLGDHRTYFDKRYGKRNLLEVHIDLDRRDTQIRKEFRDTLKLIRNEIQQQPERTTPRPTDWCGNRILEVWDLKQFGVLPKLIAETLELDGPHSLVNAYNTAHRLIDLRDWERLP